MKKILLASTALIATAGVASADVSMTGSATFGIADTSAVGVAPSFIEDVDINFSMSGETDGGISFGVSVNLDEAAGLVDRTNNGTEVWLKSDYGNLTLGDTDGGYDWALSEVGMGGSIKSNHTTHGGYNGNSGLDGNLDGQVLRYDNTFGDFGVALSVEADDTGAVGVTWGLGVKYNIDAGAANIALGLGYQKGTENAAAVYYGLAASAANDSLNVVGISAKATMDSGFSVAANWSRFSNNTAATSATHSAIGLGYTKDALTIAANYGRYSTGVSGYGVAVDYDLGGGAVIQAGYGHDSTAASSWSLGLALSF